MSGRSIFQTQQELVVQWSQKIVSHEATLHSLLTPLSKTEVTPTIVAIENLCRTKEEVLTIIDKYDDLSKEYKRRALLALTFVIDEISTLKRRIEDGDNLFVEWKSISIRITHLLVNLLKQSLGIIKTKILFEGKLEKVKLIWIAITDVIISLAVLERKVNQEKLVLTCLEYLGRDIIRDLPDAPRQVFSEQACKILKSWCEQAITSLDCFRCICLYLFINRIGYKTSGSPFARVHALSNKVSPNLPVQFGRKCLKFEHFLYQNLLEIPSYGSHLPTNFSMQRKSLAVTLSQNFLEYSKKLAHEMLFRPTIGLAEKISNLIFNLLYSHILEKLILDRSSLKSLFLLSETLSLAEKKLLDDAQIVPSKIDVINTNGLTLIEMDLLNNILNGTKTLTPTRAVAVSLLTSETYLSRFDSIRKIRRICDVQAIFTPFPELFEAFLKEIVEHDFPQISTRVPFLVQIFVNSFENIKMKQLLQEWIVDSLFKRIDEILRSRVVMKQTQDTNLKDFTKTIMDIKLALDCPLLRLGKEEMFSVRERVETKLERSWHEMRCTGIDRSWETYAEMGVLTKEYFNLNVFQDVLIPTTNSVSGCDVLELALGYYQDISGFCSKYCYNLNQEFFIEKKPNGKYVTIITVDSISKSVRAHGSGILSTVVNVVYQFLAIRLEKLSQTISDEHFKAFLRRERKWIAREQATVAGAVYLFERATDFPTQLKPQLAVTKAIITEIGNALGFVRTVRGAGMKWAASVQRFVPNGFSVEDDPTLKKHLEDVIVRRFPDYLSVLVQVVRKVVESKEHLKNVFMLIPALCVDYVDTSLHAKDQVARAHKNPNREAYFTDDGFSMGIAAILAMLSQDLYFDSLKFFKGVAMYFEGVTSSTSPPILNDNTTLLDEQDDLVVGLSKKRHRGATREYELLMYSLAGARAFFKKPQPVTSQ